MTTLITGGFGFIGRAILSRLLKSDDGLVTVIDNLLPQVHGDDADYSALAAHDRITFIKDDIGNIGAHADALTDVKTVIHLAAETGTGQSMYEIESYYRTNVQSTAGLLETILKSDAINPQKFLLSSSRSIYGEGPYVDPANPETRIYPSTRKPSNMKAGQFDFHKNGVALQAVAMREDDATIPKSVYAASKLAQEDLCRVACESMGVDFVALRLQNVYGPGQSLKNPYTGIISIFINILRQGGRINVYEDGLESRDFVFVDDVADAFVKAITHSMPSPVSLNVGSGDATSVLDLVDTIEKAMGTGLVHDITGDFRPGDIRHAWADISALQSFMDMTPKIDLKTGVQRTLEWALTQPEEQDLSQQAKAELERFFDEID